MTRTGKRGAAAPTSGGSAAVVVIIITALVILYLLFLPPEVRNDLLKDNSGTGIGLEPDSGKTTTTTLLDEQVGKLNYLRFSEQEHDIPSFTITSTTEPQLIKNIAALFVKNSWLGKTTANITFSTDLTNTANVRLVFGVKSPDGRLIIRINNHDIYNSEVVQGNPAPLAIPDEFLGDNNLLTFEASSTGWAFWRSHQFILENVQIVADITDRSRSKAEQHFSLTELEQEQFDRALLYFYPDCDQTTLGQLQIRINDKQIYSGVPDCGLLNHIELDQELLQQGDNTIKFTATEGRFLVDRIQIKTVLKNLTYPVYYFTLDEDLFGARSAQGQCGEADSICPANCEADRDPDCCYAESTYWCPTPTQNVRDRCVDYVYEEDCDRCDAGYQKKSGNPPNACEDRCGDDTDDSCPSGCSIYYDKDCCYEDNEDNYWCKEVPFTGQSNTCRASVSGQSCFDCPSGYRREGGGRPNCPAQQDDTEEYLGSKYDVNFTVQFATSDDKKLDVSVNGNRFSIDTNRLTFSRLIDADVRSGSNSIELIPRSTVEIASITIKLKKKA
ncbi:MAG: hypothetical protein V1725_03065 [archaeon]